MLIPAPTGPDPLDSLVPDFAASVLRGHGSIHVVLRGELDLATVGRLSGILLPLAAVAGSYVVVDLSDLAFIDAFGLGVLVQARSCARRCGGDLVLTGPSRAARLALVASGLDREFGLG